MRFDPDLLIPAHYALRSGMRSSFYRSVEAGRFVRLAHAVYLPTNEWKTLGTDARHLARIHAYARAVPGTVFGYRSAAALWGLPEVAGWPRRVDVIRDVHGTSTGKYAETHAVGPVPDVVELDGIRTTSLTRTLVDIASSVPMSSAVAMIDFALSSRSRSETGRPEYPVELDALLDEWARRGLRRGRTAALAAIEFGDGRSGSPGESVSRTGIHVMGAPPPILQHEFIDHLGSMWSDYWWPEFRVFGEFDGLGKYLKPEFLRPGETAAAAVIREKKREDRIRALEPFPVCARWDWATAWSLAALERTLRQAGLRW
ncbi:hypothetical protein QT381_10790 [Galbitalea sp. SE-J8]|uniref:hypothetical protein n=1 Tax=Galbitalea sp. SE-J8 TaxID=3054952 RepID=UPI00259D095E|nr:hypothetical protein [Galbitalea sp. SE-J8]MDM4763496.1 hypothetical protein [Galbitalea sp. SE-J8]